MTAKHLAAACTLALLMLAHAAPLQAQQERVLTLREAMQTALRQNVDVLLARLEQKQAQAHVQQVADPFSLKLGVGSGLAYTSGFPMNVGGSGPSIINAQASMTLFDRSQRLRVAEARERTKLPEISEQQRQQEAALDVARLYLDAEAAAHSIDALTKEIASLQRIADIRRAEVAEGRVLPLAAKQAAADVARARYRLRERHTALDNAEAQLAFVLGEPSGARIRVAREQRPQPPAPDSEAAATESAVNGHLGLSRLETELAANRFRKRAAASARWPIIRMVSQYSMFSRFNNYDDFYNRFERHNGQIGASFELPLFVGSAARAAASEADVEAEQIRLRADNLRKRIAMDTAATYRQLADARAFHELSELELETARDEVSVLLARVREGKATLPELESARAREAALWAQYYQSRAAWERASYQLLSDTGQLLAHFQ